MLTSVDNDGDKTKTRNRRRNNDDMDDDDDDDNDDDDNDEDDDDDDDEEEEEKPKRPRGRPKGSGKKSKFSGGSGGGGSRRSRDDVVAGERKVKRKVGTFDEADVDRRQDEEGELMRSALGGLLEKITGGGKCVADEIAAGKSGRGRASGAPYQKDGLYRHLSKHRVIYYDPTTRVGIAMAPHAQVSKRPVRLVLLKFDSNPIKVASPHQLGPEFTKGSVHELVENALEEGDAKLYVFKHEDE